MASALCHQLPSVVEQPDELAELHAPIVPGLSRLGQVRNGQARPSGDPATRTARFAPYPVRPISEFPRVRVFVCLEGVPGVARTARRGWPRQSWQSPAISRASQSSRMRSPLSTVRSADAADAGSPRLGRARPPAGARSPEIHTTRRRRAPKRRHDEPVAARKEARSPHSSASSSGCAS